MEEKHLKQNVLLDYKEVDIMPTVEAVETERAAYVRKMGEYLQKLKSMPDDEARRKSQVNLKNSNIIQDNGEFAERYHYSRLYCDEHER